jgi:hypothetical protein
MEMRIKNLPIEVSLDELAEVGGYDPPDKRDEYNVEYMAELRDLIGRLPSEIIRLGQKRVDRVPLTSAERKQLERFRRSRRNGGNGNKS